MKSRTTLRSSILFIFFRKKQKKIVFPVCDFNDGTVVTFAYFVDKVDRVYVRVKARSNDVTSYRTFDAYRCPLCQKKSFDRSIVRNTRDTRHLVVYATNERGTFDPKDQASTKRKIFMRKTSKSREKECFSIRGFINSTIVINDIAVRLKGAKG